MISTSAVSHQLQSTSNFRILYQCYIAKQSMTLRDTLITSMNLIFFEQKIIIINLEKTWSLRFVERALMKFFFKNTTLSPLQTQFHSSFEFISQPKKLQLWRIDEIISHPRTKHLRWSLREQQLVPCTMVAKRGTVTARASCCHFLNQFKAADRPVKHQRITYS